MCCGLRLDESIDNRGWDEWVIDRCVGDSVRVYVGDGWRPDSKYLRNGESISEL